MFGNLSDRLTAAFASLRGKGRLTDADIDSTVTEIRRALLEALACFRFNSAVFTVNYF